jgi:adenine-specific DNA-methyltransferase
LKPLKTKSFGKLNKDITKSNLVIEGDNAPVMKSLCAGVYKIRSKVDLMLWDPPYNTGNNDFIYEDNFYLTKKDQNLWKNTQPKKTILHIEPNKKGLKVKVTQHDNMWIKETDASRHSKWLSFMEVRLQLAKKLLKESGIIAVHISYHELFRLGLLMDEVFGENNRLGIVNWECYYSPKNDKKNAIPSTTDYVLVYAKDKKFAFRGVIPRTEKMNARYHSPDGDKNPWKSTPLLATSGNDSYRYGIQNPFTKKIHYPKNAYWRRSKKNIKKMLEQWGVKYKEDQRGNLVTYGKYSLKELEKKLLKPWPILNFGKSGHGVPRLKSYLKDVVKRNKGRNIGTYWSSDEILDEKWKSDEHINLSFPHKVSGHNDAAKKLIKSILGANCPFNTPKPLKLTERLIEMFCPKDGLVVDAFGGSATTAHAVLNLNLKDANRKFILIERGSKQNGFADTITAERIRRVINGKWAKPKQETTPTGGNFTYIKAGKPISGSYILESKRDDLIDIILTSHEKSTTLNNKNKKLKYVIGKDTENKAIALIWNPTKKGKICRNLTMQNYKTILNEVKLLKLKKPIFIYAAVNAGPNGSPGYNFKQIPDEILAALEATNLTE